MTGYVRSDVTNQITDGNTINAAPLDQEFDAVQAAFDFTTGHRHDGTVSDGAPITVIGPSQDVVASATLLRPKTDNVVDLGTSVLEFKDLWIDGTANIDSLVADTVDINAGTIDATVIGATTPTAATVTSLTATSGTVAGSAIATISGTQTLTNKTLTSPVITGGTIDGIAPATISGTQTLTNKTINLTNNTLVATSAQLDAAITDNTGTGALVFADSPTLTGVPVAPTAAVGTNTTQLATTAHVFAERSTTATLTNKTLTSPTLTSPTLSSGTLGGATITFSASAYACSSPSTFQSAIGVYLPKSSAGAGQFVSLSGATNTNLDLPASGTWVWFIMQRNSTTLVVNSVSSNISAGGTTIFAATVGVDTVGWAWRIG